MNLDKHNEAESLNNPAERETIHRDLHSRSVLRRVIRIAAALVVVLVIGFGVLAGSLYFLLVGDSSRGSALVTRIENGLGEIVGPEFDVDLHSANLEFSMDGLVSINGRDIRITSKQDGRILSTVGQLFIGIKLFPTLMGEPSIGSIEIDEAVFDADVLGSGSGLFLPTHLGAPIAVFGRELARFQEKLNKGEFEGLIIRNSRITGSVFGRQEDDPIEIEWLEIKPAGRDQFALNTRLGTLNSAINISSIYRKNPASGAMYEFDASGISLAEWLQDPQASSGMVASNGVIKVNGKIPFDTNNQPLEPVISIKIGNSDLRLGLREKTSIGHINLNLRLILSKNQIELDPSEIEIGRLKAKLIGGIKPVDVAVGYGGPLLYDIIMTRGLFEPTIEGENPIPAAFKVAGIFDSAGSNLTFDKITLTTKEGYITGSGEMGFAGETPSVKASAATEGISVAAVKQFWPFVIGNGARKWVHSHVLDGWIKSGSFQADIPPGILFRIRQGARLKPEQFKLKVNLERTAFRPFGEMPPIRNAAGIVSVTGMEISANLDNGDIPGAGSKPAKALSGTFRMADYAKPDRRGEITLTLDGKAETIAAIAEAKPLRLMQRMKVRADQFRGKAHVDIVAKFPIRKGIKYEEIDWNVLLDLQDGSSTQSLSGRMISRADLLIDANPKGARVDGSATIDGVKSKISLMEPIGKSGQTKRRRTITTTLDENDRKKLGLDLNPIISGPISVKIEQTAEGEIHEIDFTNAEVQLPWIGWRKGKGIAATGRFKLKKQGTRNHLNNFSLKGVGFDAKGDLVFDERGLVSADMSRVVLNEGDDFRLKVQRNKKSYDINANGLSYDARGLINKLIHEGSFAKSQGGRSVNLVANFASVQGFEGRSLQNVILIYNSTDGWLSKIDLKGVDQQNRTHTVQANREGDTTRFGIATDNAGHALAFTNIYSRMQNGIIAANLTRKDDGPFVGPITISNFDVIDEPRLEKLVSNTNRQIRKGRGDIVIKIKQDGPSKVTFQYAGAKMIKGEGYLRVKKGIVRSKQIGLSYHGFLYDENDQINLRGTFMPAIGINLAISAIPLIGQLFSNGNDNAFIGITYQLKGPRKNPVLQVNPLSIVAPGIFNSVFEFQK